jgi:hypothetical protein
MVPPPRQAGGTTFCVAKVLQQLEMQKLASKVVQDLLYWHAGVTNDCQHEDRRPLHLPHRG